MKAMNILALRVALLFLATGSALSQTTVLFQGFETDGGTWAIAGGSNNISTATGAADTPANQRILTGSRAWQANSGTVTLELQSASMAGFSSRSLRIRLASTAATSGNGADAGDFVRVFVALDGAPYSITNIQLNGNNNARWGYWATQTVSVASDASTTVAAPAGGTSTNNFSTLIVSLPDAASTISARIVASNNDANEIWSLDDVAVLGVSGSPQTNVQFTAASASIGEAGGSYTVTVYKTLAEGNVSGQVTLGGTATLSADYSINTTNFTMDGATTSATFVVSINDDGDTESSETVTLTLANLNGGTVDSPSAFTLTITDNDVVVPSGQPWINEVDYDAVGTDTNEWVEIAGPAGLSLNDYELLMISDLGVVYRTNDLAGAAWTFTDEVNGYGFFVIGRVLSGEGTADYTPSGWTQDVIQNGGTDSIQLRQKTGSVNVHLLDYEGNNTTTTEDQIATAGDDNTTALKSIFLTGGPGSGFAGFTWTNTAGGATPGAVNGGQTLTASSTSTNVKFAGSSAGVGEASVAYTVTVFKTVADGNVSGSVGLSGTATVGGDYTVDSTNFTLSGATTSATFVVSITDDGEVESAETVILTLADVTGGTVASPSVFTLTITDNDVGQSPPVLAAIGNRTTLTNAPLQFAVTATATDGDLVELSVSNAPLGHLFGSTNEVGTFTWASPAPVGVYTMTFYAADNDGADSEQITITVTSSPVPPQPLNLNVWINELHYDNAGTDVSQGFEVAGPAGTDLSLYALYLYNGGSGSVYSNHLLTGVIPNQQAGFGTLWFELVGGGADSVQNVSAGVALVYNTTGVVQFLSYEGNFVAADGPAAGETSVDIGVSESSATPVDWSLQLCGTGTNYASFAWSTNLPHSRGSLNSCQTIPGGGNPNDEDEDDLPNDWENQYFGGNTNATAGADDDGDGQSNLDEYIAGTIPVPPGGATNFFRNQGFSAAAGSVTYLSVTGRSYRLWANTNLVEGSWVEVGGPQDGNGSEQSLSDGSGTTSPVYRISVQLSNP